MISSVEEATTEIVDSATIRSVSFSVDSRDPTLINDELTHSSSEPFYLSETEHKKIEALCEKLKKCRNRGCIGFLNDEQHRHYIEVFPSTSAGEAISLGNVLRKDGERSLGLKEKYQLAVILANSVLQLHHTQWLDEYWSNNDVYVNRKVVSTYPATYDTSTYIQRAFKSLTPDQDGNIGMESSPAPPLRNVTLFALGVALIEISLGKPLEAFYNEDEKNQNGVHPLVKDFIVAGRVLIEEVAPQEAQRYVTIVNRCIYCLFDPLYPSLDNSVFRQAFYEHAVLPLKDLFRDFTS
jgi:hypothetical protein